MHPDVLSAGHITPSRKSVFKVLIEKILEARSAFMKLGIGLKWWYLRMEGNFIYLTKDKKSMF